ncbi:MAG TPA: MgtC/SapB family protein, partial [Candidatus Angelobacter sp.]|nr:MgtC/SapB family protein [Candidatus Angelobacter sp.]
MNGPLDFVAHPEIALLRVLVAGLLGGLIGMERERAAQESGEEMFAGVRTFPLFAILGASLAIVSGSIGAAVVSGFLAVTALAVVAYWRTSTPEHAGVTTEGAALATYWVGAMAGAGALTLAGAVGITIAVLLAAKERLESFPRAMSREELRATLTLAVIAAVILPLLPDRGYGPWEVWNPRRIWLVVVFVCGLSFAAFLAVRFWGAKKGVYATGILGGLASSTALTASLASQSRVLEKAGAYLAVGAGLA